MSSANKDEDVVAALKCLSAEDRFASLGSLAYQVERLVFFRTPLHEKASDLLKRNGLDGFDIMGALQVADSPGGTGVNMVFKAAGRKVQDQFGFAKEASELLASLPKPEGNQTAARPALTLSNVIVSGDTATGVLSADGSSETTPIHFVREDGAWRISTVPKPTNSNTDDRTMP